MLLFFGKKNGKIAAALGAPPPTPIGFWQLGNPTPDPKLFLPSLAPVTLKLLPIISYLSIG